jgi:hypothetical protein
MGKVYAEISPSLGQWMEQQPLFFVATAPLARDGHINCSPKGGDCFRVIDPLTVAYQDLTGSGAETLAHLRENGRLVIMFCAFQGPPNIVRLHGQGEVLTPEHPEFDTLVRHFPDHPGTRSVIRLGVTRVSDSCGYGVPLMAFQGPRDALYTWSDKKGPEGLAAYRQQKNSRSIDGLPAWDTAGTGEA